MQFLDAFPARLEQLFSLKDQDETQVEVLNFGVPGFSTYHELGLVEKAIRHRSDLILLQITLNDPQLKSYQPTGLKIQQPFGAFSPQGFLKTLTNWSALSRLVLTRLHNSNTHQAYINYYQNLFRHERALEQFTNALSQMARATRDSKTTFGAVVFPLFGLPLDENYPFHDLHAQVHTLLKERGIPSLDLFEAFQGIPLERIQVVPGQDFHPNEIGHRIAAESIISWLSDQELVPSELIPNRSLSKG